MHSLSNSLFGSQESYWRGGVGSPYSSLQPLSGMATNLGNSYSPYDQYSTHPAVASRYHASCMECLLEIMSKRFTRSRKPSRVDSRVYCVVLYLWSPFESLPLRIDSFLLRMY